MQQVKRIFHCYMLLSTVLAGFISLSAHADVFGGFQGAIKGGIPAYTRDIKHNKPFWCNQYKLVRKMCEVVAQSENGRVAIVRMVPTTWKCPNGIWGVVDRSNGDAMELIPAAKMSLEQYCSKAFRAGFVKPRNRKSLADVVMYYNGKPIDSFEYLEE
ncbi:hypothetical protein DS513_09365 [Salmonella enterica subsp. enterica serovar Sandiego]|nr:hypothetical protein [Salmonella enterica subsp. enterica serovar Sandiego]EJF5173576.1 hypothetical protein [Salmonella enterica]